MLAAAVLISLQPHLLRVDLAAPWKESYQMTAKMDQVVSLGAAGMGDQEVVTTMTGKMSYIAERAGSDGYAPITLSFTGLKMEADIMGMPGPDLPDSMKATGKVSPRGQITDLAFVGEESKEVGRVTSFVRGTLFGILYPEEPLDIGESWTFKVPAEKSTGMQESIATATLEAEEQVNGQDAFKVVSKADLVYSGPLEAPTDMALPFEMTMTISGTGVTEMTFWIDKSTGRLIKSEGVSSMKSETTIQELGMTTPSQGETRLTITRAARD